jgi:hypothetical protein
VRPSQIERDAIPGRRRHDHAVLHRDRHLAVARLLEETPSDLRSIVADAVRAARIGDPEVTPLFDDDPPSTQTLPALMSMPMVFSPCDTMWKMWSSVFRSPLRHPTSQRSNPTDVQRISDAARPPYSPAWMHVENPET